MATVAPHTLRHAPQRQWLWRIALAATSLVAVAGFALAVNQFVINYLYDQNPHTRTLPGLLMMLLGATGIGVPILILRRRERFLSLRRSVQSTAVLGLPVAYLLLLVLCLEASLRSTHLILPRPFLPTAVVRYSPGDSRVEFVGRWGGGQGSNDAEIQGGVEKFSSHMDQSYIQGFLPGAVLHPDERLVTIAGRAERLQDGTVQIILDVDAVESIRFAVENLDDVSITRAGQPVGQAALDPGEYTVTITGTLKRNT